MEENQLSYKQIELSNNRDLHLKLAKQTGQTTVPYIFINNEFIDDDLRVEKFDWLMIQDPQVSRHYFIFQNSSSWNVNPVSMISDDDHSSSQAHWSYLINA